MMIISPSSVSSPTIIMGEQTNNNRCSSSSSDASQHQQQEEEPSSFAIITTATPTTTINIEDKELIVLSTLPTPTTEEEYEDDEASLLYQQQQQIIEENRKRRGAVNVVPVQFGQQLETIPQFILFAFDYMRANGNLLQEGLFRLPGAANEIQELKQKLNNGNFLCLADCTNVHTVGSLIKLYFRELPIPLCTYECYDMFMLADGVPIPEYRLDCLKKVLCFIPDTNFRLLSKLCLFLNEVTQYSQYNKMTAHNLAIVFSPNLLVSDTPNPILKTKITDPQQVMSELASSQNVIGSFIEYADFFFNSPFKSYMDYLERENLPIITHDDMEDIEREEEEQQKRREQLEQEQKQKQEEEEEEEAEEEAEDAYDEKIWNNLLYQRVSLSSSSPSGRNRANSMVLQQPLLRSSLVDEITGTSVDEVTRALVRVANTYSSIRRPRRDDRAARRLTIA